MATIIQHASSLPICSTISQMSSDITNKSHTPNASCKTRSQSNGNLQKLKRKNPVRSSSGSETSSSSGGCDKGGKASGGRQAPKEKEPHLVQRRNARERRRVQLVNDGFIRLRRKIPTEPRNKKLSKVKTLRSAINYILHLQQVITESDTQQQGMVEFGGHHHPHHHPHHPHAQPGGYGLGMGGLIGGHAGSQHQMPVPPAAGGYEWDHYAENQQPMGNGYDYQPDVPGGYYY